MTPDLIAGILLLTPPALLVLLLILLIIKAIAGIVKAKDESKGQISVPKTCRCSTAETNHQVRVTRRASGVNKAE